MFNIVLVYPQIPQNTGSIGRLCVNTNCKLHIVKPTCFHINDKNIKRAGLDYWNLLDITIWDSLDDFLAAHGNKKDNFYFATTKSSKPYFDVEFKKNDFIFLGGESTGLPLELMKVKWENAITIPMGKNGRSLNQAVSAGIILYDAIRQNYLSFKAY
ncbi:MAG: tRNA (cytidine(34)-2'-O)-methyltransferase [Sulfurospirillum sp.]|nr:tRNA (cytidine(34)-2'-O)-methyltransferase [Sulfurospirillum sp.]MBL0702720.1 tRNA (cytidine(34)-2'-O)-methyltransferase [Sulfurospirillum sp.]